MFQVSTFRKYMVTGVLYNLFIINHHILSFRFHMCCQKCKNSPGREGVKVWQKLQQNTDKASVVNKDFKAIRV